jgi:hypothetical protein
MGRSKKKKLIKVVYQKKNNASEIVLASTEMGERENIQI